MIKREKSPFTIPPLSPFTKGGCKRIMWGRGWINSEAGFSLVELMITMVVFVFVIAAASQVFTGLLTQFKQQSKIAETNIEGIVGLEILRQDIEHAGYGLPWYGLVAYSESSTNPYSLNDSTSTAAPRAVLSKDNATFSGLNNIFDGSDYLVIKSVNVARNDACERWTTLSSTSPYVRTWTPSTENLVNNDRVIVLRPGSTDADGRTLVVSGSTFSTTFSSVTSTTWRPADTSETRIVYGIKPIGDPASDPRMPFNRADYYILKFDSDGNDIVPTRCAPNTGILRKAIVNHSAGTFAGGTLPLLDCVADMQVVYRLNTGAYTADISTLNAQQIREQVREVRVYILAHEGQRDVNYTHSIQTINLAEDVGVSLGQAFNLATEIGTGWQNYRWKVYTIVVKPINLR